jgi:DNA end-binding protein Ku
VLTTLRYAHEIRSADSLGVPAAGRGEKRQLALARQLIDTLARDWEPTRYRNTYRDVLLKVIEQKAKGEPISVPAPRRPARVVDLTRPRPRRLETYG